MNSMTLEYTAYHINGVDVSPGVLISADSFGDQERR